ncbi:unnamed protein product [Ambrosiozyma monospora]|uniref:Unnamed protein product n=1 Tax=Ambrosiozyma monospora TaxID=43982 RepID=A0A9W7DHE3_AMBMO|nr:unnamed protein product [Ambrosiozyma monospora]
MRFIKLAKGSPESSDEHIEHRSSSHRSNTAVIKELFVKKPVSSWIPKFTVPIMAVGDRTQTAVRLTSHDSRLEVPAVPGPDSQVITISRILSLKIRARQLREQTQYVKKDEGKDDSFAHQLPICHVMKHTATTQQLLHEISFSLKRTSSSSGLLQET